MKEATGGNKSLQVCRNNPGPLPPSSRHWPHHLPAVGAQTRRAGSDAGLFPTHCHFPAGDLGKLLKTALQLSLFVKWGVILFPTSCKMFMRFKWPRWSNRDQIYPLSPHLLRLLLKNPWGWEWGWSGTDQISERTVFSTGHIRHEV